MSRLGIKTSLSDRLAKFESMDSTDGGPLSKPDGFANPGTRFRMFQAANVEKCHLCDKRVYINDKITADNLNYHKTCFKCVQCRNTLRLGNYASLDGRIYCKPHFISLFKQKGNYEEGFGKERHKNKWLDKAPVEAPKSISDYVLTHRKPSLTGHVTQQRDVIGSTTVNVAYAAPRTQKEIRKLSNSTSFEDEIPVSRRSRFSRDSRSMSQEKPTTPTWEKSPSPGNGIDYEEGPKKKRESFHFKGMSAVKAMWEKGGADHRGCVALNEEQSELEKIRQAAPRGTLKSRYRVAIEEASYKTVLHPKPSVLPAKSMPNLQCPGAYEDGIDAVGHQCRFEAKDQMSDMAPKSGNLQSLLARFSSLQAPGNKPELKPKPKHTITPPREESPQRSGATKSDRDYEEAANYQSDEQEEDTSGRDFAEGRINGHEPTYENQEVGGMLNGNYEGERPTDCADPMISHRKQGSYHDDRNERQSYCSGRSSYTSEPPTDHADSPISSRQQVSYHDDQDERQSYRSSRSSYMSEPPTDHADSPISSHQQVSYHDDQDERQSYRSSRSSYMSEPPTDHADSPISSRQQVSYHDDQDERQSYRSSRSSYMSEPPTDHADSPISSRQQVSYHDDQDERQSYRSGRSSYMSEQTEVGSGRRVDSDVPYKADSIPNIGSERENSIRSSRSDRASYDEDYERDLEDLRDVFSDNQPSESYSRSPGHTSNVDIMQSPPLSGNDTLDDMVVKNVRYNETLMTTQEVLLHQPETSIYEALQRDDSEDRKYADLRYEDSDTDKPKLPQRGYYQDFPTQADDEQFLED